MSRTLPHTTTAAPQTDSAQIADAQATATQTADTPKALSSQEATTDAQTDTPTAPSDWYTDTLRTIVSRALNADKPDIKGALAALQLLAETEDTTTGQDDVAAILRDARRRVIHGRQN